MKSLNIENLQFEWLSSFKDCVFEEFSTHILALTQNIHSKKSVSWAFLKQGKKFKMYNRIGKSNPHAMMLQYTCFF